jgi:hypothetical protein
VAGATKAEKIKMQVPIYEYTKSGILFELIIKSLNLREVITITRRKGW